MSYKKIFLTEILAEAYNFHGWTSKPAENYSANSKKNLQATGTTNNNERMQWYWIGTKNM